MSGYPHNPPGYGGSPGAPQYPYEQQPPYGAPPASHKPDKPPKDAYSQSYYGAPSSDPHKLGKPPKDDYSQSYYGGSAPPMAQPYGAPPASYKPDKPGKPPKDDYSQSYYGGSAPPMAQPYGAPPASHKPDKPPKDDYSPSYYGGSAPPMAQPYGAPPASHKPDKPPKDDYSPSYYGGSAPPMAQSYGAPPPYGNPFASLAPSAFPPGTDPNVIECFKAADHDGSGLIDDKELQMALSSYSQSFSLRTVHLLMYLFTNTNSRRIGPKEFTSVYYSLQSWRSIFDRYDRDRSGKIDSRELQEALLSLGYTVSPVVLDLLVLKFDKTGGKSRSIEYDGFIECCLTVKGLTDKFKAKDMNHSGSATFFHEEFMLMILPFIVA